MSRDYAIERDETGRPCRMVWLGDRPERPKVKAAVRRDANSVLPAPQQPTLFEPVPDTAVTNAQRAKQERDRVQTSEGENSYESSGDSWENKRSADRESLTDSAPLTTFTAGGGY